MNLSKKLIGHESLFKNLIKIYNSKKLPNAILLNGEKGIGKSLFAIHLMNYFLSQKEDYKYSLENQAIDTRNKSYTLFQNNCNPNICLVKRNNDKKSIEISQIRELIKFQNNSSFNNYYKFILIDNISDLNLNASNALLKSIEEPNDKVFYILTHNTGSIIQNTLKSRCIIFKMYLNNESIKLIVNDYFSESIFDSISKDLINYYVKPSFIISLINYLNESSIDYKSIKIEDLLVSIIKNKDFVKNKFVNENINTFIELFFYKNINLSSKSLFKLKNYFYLKINQIKKYNLDMETFFIEFQQKLLNE
tara:strand:- start:397 stop:1317 length:921 start_codon:yes stop_codon:yes gene_type:complete